MMATTMTANVAMVIIPGQRKVVAALREGRAGRSDPRPARQAAQRPQHLLHAAGRLHDDQQPLRLRLRREAQLARPGRPDAGRRAGARLVRAAPQGAGRAAAGAVALRDRRHASRRRDGRAAAAGAARGDGADAGADLRRGRGDRRAALQRLPQRGAGEQERPPRFRRRDPRPRAGRSTSRRSC